MLRWLLRINHAWNNIWLTSGFTTAHIGYSPITVGSKSTNTARGTCFPAPVSLKKVLKESSPPPMVLSLGIWPSGWMPCSRQYSSQQALPIWTPAWPTWILMHSRCKHTNNFFCVLSKLYNIVHCSWPEYMYIPSRHNTLNQCWFNVGPNAGLKQFRW